MLLPYTFFFVHLHVVVVQGFAKLGISLGHVERNDFEPTCSANDSILSY